MIRTLLMIALAAIVFASSGCTTGGSGGRVRDVNLRTVSDGSFVGSASYNIGTFMVQTRVQRHRIVDIRVLGTAMTYRESQAQKVIPLVIARQTLKVGVVRGAEIESRTLLKAIENSLREGAMGGGMGLDLRSEREWIIRQELGR